jgi:hypothetical protein
MMLVRLVLFHFAAMRAQTMTELKRHSHSKPCFRQELLLDCETLICQAPDSAMAPMAVLEVIVMPGQA